MPGSGGCASDWEPVAFSRNGHRPPRYSHVLEFEKNLKGGYLGDYIGDCYGGY